MRHHKLSKAALLLLSASMSASSLAASAIEIDFADQCIREVNQLPTGYQNVCGESVVIHWQDMYGWNSFTVQSGQKRNPSRMGNSYYVCPERVRAQRVKFDIKNKVCILG